MKNSKNIISLLIICIMLMFYLGYQDGRTEKKNHPIKSEQSKLVALFVPY